MTDYRVIIAGGRDFINYLIVKERCEYYLQNKMKTHNVIIVSGHASGAGIRPFLPHHAVLHPHHRQTDRE